MDSKLVMVPANTTFPAGGLSRWYFEFFSWQRYWPSHLCTCFVRYILDLAAQRLKAVFVGAGEFYSGFADHYLSLFIPMVSGVDFSPSFYGLRCLLILLLKLDLSFLRVEA